MRFDQAPVSNQIVPFIGRVRPQKLPDTVRFCWTTDVADLAQLLKQTKGASLNRGFTLDEKALNGGEDVLKTVRVGAIKHTREVPAKADIDDARKQFRCRLFLFAEKNLPSRPEGGTSFEQQFHHFVFGDHFDLEFGYADCDVIILQWSLTAIAQGT